MHASLSRPAITTLGLLTALAVLLVPSVASALFTPPSGLGQPLISGTTAYVQTSDGLRERSLLTGETQTLPLPEGYASWNEQPVAADGTYAAAGGGPAGTVFVTSRTAGLRVVPPVVTSPEPCPARAQVLKVTPGGRLTVLYTAFAKVPAADSCRVDVAASRLVEIAATGAVQELWLPASYRAWLDQGDAAGRSAVMMRGSRLLIARAATSTRSGGFVMLDASTQKTLRKVNGGSSFATAYLAGRDVVTTDSRRFVRRVWFRPSSGGRRLVYRGTGSPQFSVCGNRVAISGIGSIELRSSSGRRLYRRAYRGNYTLSTVSCSARVLHYRINPNYPESGDGPTPGLPKAKSRTLLLSQLH